MSIVKEKQGGYEIRPGFKQTELGLIPEDWNLVPLRDFGTWFSGGIPSKKKQSYWIGEVLWVSPKDMKRSRLCDSIDHISGSEDCVRTAYTIEVDPSEVHHFHRRPAKTRFLSRNVSSRRRVDPPDQ